jgi:mannose-6-phosphate isomerase-like protein (cupin superfamily)
MEAIVRGPGQGDVLEVAGNRVEFKAEAHETGGALGLVDYTAAAGFPGPPPHIHREMTDMFFVLEGTLTLRVGEETLEAGPGTFAMVPPGTVHTFSNPGSEPVRFLSLVSPGGFERYFRDLAAAVGDGPLNPAVVGPIVARYDVEPA